MDHSASKHPLEPAKGWTIHVKGGNSESIVIWCLVKIKELSDFENPPKSVRSIETGYLKLHVRFG
jgi:hypothetical protein